MLSLLLKGVLYVVRFVVGFILGYVLAWIADKTFMYIITLINRFKIRKANSK